MKALKDFQIEAIHRKISFLLGLVGGLVLIAGVALIAKFGDLQFISSKIDKNNSRKTQKQTITIAGIPSCLPLKSGEKVESSNYEYGIKTSDGKFYAIGSSGSNPISLYGEAGSEGVEISGEFIPAGKNEELNIEGTILQ